MRRCLVGHGIRPHAAAHQFGIDFGRIAQQADRNRLAGTRHDGQRFVDIVGRPIEVTGLQAHLDAAGLAFHGEARGTRHHRRQRLGAAHAAQPGRQHPAAGKIAAIMLSPHLDERLVGALHDALRADIDPRAGGHLAIHGQALGIEFVEMLPGRPFRHQVGIGDQDARRIFMGAKHPDWLARLHQQRLVIAQPAQRVDDAVETVPVACCPPDAAIDNQFLRVLRHAGIQIVHQHAQRGFRLPGLRRAVRPGWRHDRATIV
jgi:hypothetical protein